MFEGRIGGERMSIETSGAKFEAADRRSRRLFADDGEETKEEGGEG